jgi:hypothetical protein
LSPRARLALALAAALIAAPAASAQPETRTFTGPALVCGMAFALRIEAGETVEYRDPGIDFLLYYARGPYGGFLLYEGNAPMAHDDEIRTGRPFPEMIAIHDNRTPEAKARSRIRDRLLVGEAFAAACAGRGTAR